MLFVNEIALIVHTCVDKYSGTCNRNLGDAWLLAWKVPESETMISEDKNGETQKLIKTDSKIVNNLADLALASLLKICATT